MIGALGNTVLARVSIYGNNDGVLQIVLKPCSSYGTTLGNFSYTWCAVVCEAVTCPTRP